MEIGTEFYYRKMVVFSWVFLAYLAMILPIVFVYGMMMDQMFPICKPYFPAINQYLCWFGLGIPSLLVTFLCLALLASPFAGCYGFAYYMDHRKDDGKKKIE